jgi:hypothetical protein
MRLYIGTADVSVTTWHREVKRLTGFDAVPIAVRRDQIQTMIEMQYVVKCAKAHAESRLVRQYGIAHLTMTGFQQFLSAQTPEVPRSELERGQCVPISVTREKKLLLGMVNPRKEDVIQKLQALTGLDIEPVVIAPDELPKMLRLYLRRSTTE